MRRRFVVALLMFGLLVPTGLSARPQNEPGYFPIDEFGILSSDSLSLEINLNDALLGLVAAALKNEEPELAAMIGALQSIRVRFAEADDFDVDSVRSGLKQAAGWLDKHDWSPMVRLREDDEELYVYTRITEGAIQGMAVLAVNDGEAVLVNIVGLIDAARLADLADALDLPQLGLAAGLSSRRDQSSDASDEKEDNR